MKEKLIEKGVSKLYLSSLTVNKIWVYALYNSQQQLIFMYYGKLEDIVVLSPFRINEKFNDGEVYTCVLLNCYNTKIEAENALSSWMKESELEGEVPPYNIYNKAYNNDKYIYCEEDGKYYRSAQDVVKIFKVSQPALSTHLRGVAGYKSVNGLHFRYVHNTVPDEVEIAGGMKMQKGQLGGFKYVRSENPLNVEGLTRDQIRDIIERTKDARVEWILNGGVL